MPKNPLYKKRLHRKPPIDRKPICTGSPRCTGNSFAQEAPLHRKPICTGTPHCTGNSLVQEASHCTESKFLAQVIFAKKSFVQIGPCTKNPFLQKDLVQKAICAQTRFHRNWGPVILPDRYALLPHENFPCLRLLVIHMDLVISFPELRGGHFFIFFKQFHKIFFVPNTDFAGNFLYVPRCSGEQIFRFGNFQ